MKEIFDLDDIYRLGGDEFIIIMDNVKKLDKMDKLRKFKRSSGIVPWMLPLVLNGWRMHLSLILA